MINTLLYNIRGVSKASNLRRLKKIIRLHGVQFVAISEPKLDVSQVKYICMKLSFDYAIVNISEDLWIFYSCPFICSVVGNSNQHISLSIQHPWLPGPLILSFCPCYVFGRGTAGFMAKFII